MAKREKLGWKEYWRGRAVGRATAGRAFLCLFTVFVGTEEADPLVVVEMAAEVARDLCWAVKEADTRWSRATLRAGRGRSLADRQDEKEVAAARDEEVGIRITFHQVEEKNDGSVAAFSEERGGGMR